MPLSDKAREVLAKMAGGKSLCFSQDGDLAWLSGLKPMSAVYDAAIQELMKHKLIASAPDAEHWTEANSFDITEAGRKALVDRTVPRPLIVIKDDQSNNRAD